MDFLPSVGAFGATDPLFLLLAALAIEAYAGDIIARLPRVPHPRGVMARAARALELRLNRPQRARKDLIVRGAVTVLTLAVAAAVVGVLIAWLRNLLHFVWVVEVFLLIAMVSQRGSGRQAARVAESLKAEDVTGAREHLRPLAGEMLDPQRLDALDARGLALAALQGLAQRFTAGVVAPVFWYVLLGLPGVLLQQAVRSTASVVATGNRPGGGGYTPASEGDFAFPAVRLDAALQWIPDKIAGLLLTFAAVFIPTTKPLRALRRLRPGRSWSVAALGGALTLAARADASISPVAAPGPRELKRALGLFAVGCLINAGIVAAIVLLRQAV